VSLEVFAGAVLNYDPPDLCFPNSYEYRCEPPVPDKLFSLNARKWRHREVKYLTQGHTARKKVEPGSKSRQLNFRA
jgi:hypothetical protein